MWPFFAGYLEKVTSYLVDRMHAAEESADDDHVISPSPSSSSKTPDFLKVLTTPFTELIIQLDKQVLKGWATNEEKYVNATTILRLGCHNSNSSSEGAGGCDYLFAYLGEEGAGLGEAVMGVILLLLSLVMLCTCLIGNTALTTIQRDFTYKLEVSPLRSRVLKHFKLAMAEQSK
jgi:hypothetical protein